MNDCYSSAFSKYEFYNFHDQKKINGLARRIIAEGSWFPILLLIGEIGVGRSYFLQSVVYNLKHSHPHLNFDYAPLDLKGFEMNTDIQGLQQYAEQQLSYYGDIVDQSILKEIIRAKPKEEPTSILDGIQISVLPWLAITIKALRDIWTYSPDMQVRAPKSKGKERFHDLMERICQNRRVILHVLHPELIDLVVKRWLFDEMRRIDNLQIAFSIESGENHLKDYCLQWQYPFEEITFDILNLQSLTAAIDQRFSPNQFPDDFYQLLWKYSHGNTKKLAIAFQRLVSKDCITEKRDGWVTTANLPLMHDRFSDELYEPIDKILHNPIIGHGFKIYQFLLLLALCGGTAPVNLIFDYLRLNIQEQEELDDVIEEYLIDTESPWLIDHGYNHPSFQGDLVYSFTHTCYTSFFLERTREDERKNSAASLFNFFYGRMSIDTKLKASIMLRLAKFGNLYDKIEEYYNNLCWWIDKANSDKLKDMLIDQLKKGDLAPVSLWKHINFSRGKKSPLITLALLDSYKVQPEGIPAENLISFLEMRSITLFNLGKYSEALSDAYLADGMTTETESLRKAQIKSIIGLCLTRLGSYEKALPSLKYANETFTKILGINHPGTAASLNNLAGLYRSQGRYEEAEPLYQQAMAIYKKVLGEEHPDFATSLNNLALLYEFQGRYEEAEPLYKQAMTIRKKVLGEEHPDTKSTLQSITTIQKALKKEETVP